MTSDPLLAAAVAGTSAAELPPASHPADEVVPADRPREEVLLLRAGARRLYDAAGRVPRTDVTPPDPSPEETAPVGSDRLGSLLEDHVLSGKSDLLVPTLHAMNAAGVLLPPSTLPSALAASKEEVRELVRPLLGERGRWLASLRRDWSWASGGAVDVSESADLDTLEAAFEHGSTRERVAALEAARRVDAAAARGWVEASFKADKAPVRETLLRSLRVGLSPDDEPFLTACLNDRAAGVKAAAAALLVSLPESELSVRFRGRADAMLSLERKGRIKKRTVLVCDPPEELPSDWKADGVPEKADSGRGQRATWAVAVLRLVPLSHWSERFEKTPAELVEASQEGDFADAVFEAWLTASADGLSMPEWDAALIAGCEAYAPRKGRVAVMAAEGLLSLAPSADEATVVAVAERAVGGLRGPTHAAAEFLIAYGRELPKAAADAILKNSAKLLAKTADHDGSSWATQLVRLAPLLPIESLRGPPLEVGPQGKQAWHHNATESAVAQFEELRRVRIAIDDEIKAALK